MHVNTITYTGRYNRYIRGLFLIFVVFVVLKYHVSSLAGIEHILPPARLLT